MTEKLLLVPGACLEEGGQIVNRLRHQEKFLLDFIGQRQSKISSSSFRFLPDKFSGPGVVDPQHQGQNKAGACEDQQGDFDGNTVANGSSPFSNLTVARVRN